MPTDGTSPERRLLRAGHEQKCPMCKGPVAAGAAVCRNCGVDLTRSGLVISSAVTPISRRGARRWNPAISGRMLIALIAIVAIGLVSTVGAQVPFLRPLNAGAAKHAFLRVAAWGKGLWPHSAPAKPSPAATKPSDVVTVASQPSTPVAVAPAPASVVILTDPAGAQAVVDSTAAGMTPLTLKNVAPGQHQVSLQRNGYQQVSRTFTLEPGESVTLNLTLSPTVRVARRPARPAASTPSPTHMRKPLEVGARAPHFVLKDRVGIIYRLNDLRGQRVAILFVWRLDAQARGAIKDLDARARKGTAPFTPVVIAIVPDRVAIRNLITTDQIRIPILFGNAHVAELYGVTQGVHVLYVLSEQGIVVRRQAGAGQLASLFP